MKVRNVNGTAEKDCRCGSWLDHWLRFSGQPLPTYCPEQHCREKPEVGAFVQKDDDSRWYIIPLCAEHSTEKGGTLTVTCSVELVSARVSDTCGRPPR